MAISPVNDLWRASVTARHPTLCGMSKSYLLLGPPDILHDLLNDFAEDGWSCSADRWQAVITRPEGDHGPDPGAWPAEVSLQGISNAGHEAACREHLAPTE
jgi:hypothetical protein